MKLPFFVLELQQYSIICELKKQEIKFDIISIKGVLQCVTPLALFDPSIFYLQDSQYQYASRRHCVQNDI